MAFVDELLKKAKAANKTIVLCEGEDKRVVDAAAQIVWNRKDYFDCF